MGDVGIQNWVQLQAGSIKRVIIEQYGGMQGRDVHQHIQPDLPSRDYDQQVDSSLLLSKIQYDPQSQSKEKPALRTPSSYNSLNNGYRQIKKPYCGCGQYYSCTSSLYLHIRTKHAGIPPPGTVGGPKGIVKKSPAPPSAVKMEEQDEDAMIRTENGGRPEMKIVVGRSGRGTVEPGPKNCQVCGRVYSCNSSLNLHMKRKHNWRKNERGEVEIQKQSAEVPGMATYECKFCGTGYGSKSALGLHYNNKHSTQDKQIVGMMQDDNIHRCGCGQVYQSRSALNSHVKKKHDGEYPQGTDEKSKMYNRYEFQNTNTANQTKIKQKREENIYDSDSDGEGHSGKRQRSRDVLKNNFMPTEDDGKPFKCGCGRSYTCSSSLNLHIKKNHDWKVPEGTIGGPRGMRIDDQQSQRWPPSEVRAKRENLANMTKRLTEQQEQSSEVKREADDDGVHCEQCQVALTEGSFFKCNNCQNHYMCSGCFWNKNNVDDGDHEWTVFNA